MAAVLEITQDPSSPYYIHPSDSSLQSFVTDKFNGEGFSSWKRSMLIGFSTKNKMGFIDGSLPKPAETDPKYNAWIRCNDMVIGWILKALGSVPAKSVFFFKTANAMWKDLVTRYGQTTSTQLYSLQEEIASLVQGNDGYPSNTSNGTRNFTNTRNGNQRKYANCVSAEDNTQSSEQEKDIVQTVFTKDQYSQILKLLDKQGDAEAMTGPDSSGNSAYFAGQSSVHHLGAPPLTEELKLVGIDVN